MARPNSQSSDRVLLVEGQDDKHVVLQLCNRHESTPSFSIWTIAVHIRVGVTRHPRRDGKRCAHPTGLVAATDGVIAQSGDAYPSECGC